MARLAEREAVVAKQKRMASPIGEVSITMLEATDVLTENLTQSEPFLRLKEAGEKFKADQDAVKLLRDLSELQQKIRQEQYSGGISEGDLKQLRALQSAAFDNESIQEYEIAQEYAVAFLREVNQEISQLLGVDFASLTRRGSGC